MSGVSEAIGSRVWEKRRGESASPVLPTPKEKKSYDSRVQETSIGESGSRVSLTPKEKNSYVTRSIRKS